MVDYPVRARIIDVTGEMLPNTNIALRTPEASKPFIGREGLAEKLANGRVRVTLDGGGTIFGDECWWEPLNG